MRYSRNLIAPQPSDQTGVGLVVRLSRRRRRRARVYPINCLVAHLVEWWFGWVEEVVMRE